MNEGVKQRLVGAVVLVSAALILWPLVMSPKRERSIVIESAIPEPPSQPPSRIEEPRRSPDVPSGGEYRKQLEKTESAPAPAAERPSPSLDRDGMPIAWIVQVGSFGNRANAVKLSQALQNDGYRAYMKPQKTAKRTLNRVIVGPYVEKVAAQRDRNKIAAKHQLKPEVMRFKP